MQNQTALAGMKLSMDSQNYQMAGHGKIRQYWHSFGLTKNMYCFFIVIIIIYFFSWSKGAYRHDEWWNPPETTDEKLAIREAASASVGSTLIITSTLTSVCYSTSCMKWDQRFFLPGAVGISSKNGSRVPTT